MPLKMKRFAKPGTAPGTLRPVEALPGVAVEVEVFAYGPDELVERHAASLGEATLDLPATPVTWIDVVGLHDVDLLQELGRRYGLHPLALEDVLNLGQRPKMEEYDDHLFIVMKLLHGSDVLDAEQISIFVGESFVITLQERPGDLFTPVRERIRRAKGLIRGAGPDYLAYALVDALVDQFFPILEGFGERIEDLEDELVDNPSSQTLQQIHRLKKELLAIRRAAWPQREVISALGRHEGPPVHATTKIFLRDCYDHTVQILDIVENYRDVATSMLDVYLSSVSNRTNEIMKVLTIMASIFIPMTFVAGVYGMNFDPGTGPWSMPELRWAWGYRAFWMLNLGLAGAMLVYFRRRDWL